MADFENLQRQISDRLLHSVPALSQPPYACDTLVPLSGGVANFTFRGKLKTALSTAPGATAEQSIVIKHAEPYLPRAISFKFDARRAYYEQMMITALSTLEPETVAGIRVTSSTLYHYDEPTATLLLQEFDNSLSLKDYVTTYDMSTEVSRRFGAAVGTWTKRFHAWAAAPEQAALRQKMAENTSMRELKLIVFSGRLPGKADALPELAGSKELFVEIAATLRKECEDPGPEGVLIHGDLWSGNLLVPRQGLDDSDETPLQVIDYELSHIQPKTAGVSVDIGQCLAEFYLFSHFKQLNCGTLMSVAFLSAYQAEAPLSDDLRFRVALQFGIHFLSITSSMSEWGEEQRMKDLILLGRDCITAAWTKDKSWFLNHEGDAHELLRQLFA